MAVTVRLPAVAGRFYPLDANELRSQVGEFLSPSPHKKLVNALACIAPHAGYMYSGHVAGAVFAEVDVPELCLVLCPNHTGLGRPLAIMSDGVWETPLGQVPIDSALANSLKQRCVLLEEDSSAHAREHAIEVELPFLQSRQPRLRFVPLALGTRHFEVLTQLGEALADVIAVHHEPVLIIASSDMNHHECDAITRVKDQAAIDSILALDPLRLYEAVTRQNISMCGFGPVVATLTAANRLGAKSAELIKYATSGEISGDLDTVVGYAGIAIR